MNPSERRLDVFKKQMTCTTLILVFQSLKKKKKKKANLIKSRRNHIVSRIFAHMFWA